MNSTNATKTVGQYQVHEGRQDWLLEKLSKLNRKAAKLGVPGVTIEWTGEKLVRRQSDAGEEFAVDRYLLVTLTGVAPKVDGWTFVATLSHADEAGTVIRTAPGFAEQVPLIYRNATADNCDHCKKVRRRRDTYLVQNEAGEWKQVGANCLGDFLGGIDPHKIAKWAEFSFEVDEAAGSAGGFGGESRVDLGIWLAHVAAAIRVEGRWTSKKALRAYMEQVAPGEVVKLRATAEIASSRLFATTDKEKALTQKYAPISEDFTYAEAALAWAREAFHAKDPMERNEFEHNLVVATSSEAITHRNLGIAAAAVGMYKRHLEAEVERRARADAGKNSDYLGAEGERKVFWAKLLAPVKSWESNFGMTHLYRLITREGSMVIWFGSHRIEELVEGGEFVGLIGTIKKLETFKEQKQTVVSRMALATQKQIDKATGDDKRKKVQAKEAARIEARFEQLTNGDW